MSINESCSINLTEKSGFLDSICEVDDSASLKLNDNIELSKLDISGIAQNTSQPNILQCSVTLDQREQELLNRPERLLENSLTADSVESQTIELSTSANATKEVTAQATDEETPLAEDSQQLEEDTAMSVESQTIELSTSADVTKEVTAQATDEETALAEDSQQLEEDTTMSVDEASLHEMEFSRANEDEFFQHSLVELGRRIWTSSSKEQQYSKGCLWSPDGTCLLVPVHLNGMHVVELPTDLYDITKISKLTERAVSPLPSAVHVKEGGTVYDFVWYPFMQSNAPETCCWLATRQHEPIHMWDAFSGELRCSYRGYDDVDEVESAISIAFTHDGQKVYGGYKKSIKVFDTNIPGRDCVQLPVKKTVSCFALTTDNDQTLTCGSWNGHIYHYDLRVPKLGALFTLGGHCGGITWLRYAAGSEGEWLLFSGARRDNKILQWDMRNYSEPIREFNRTVATNQRIYFDLSPQQHWLASGDTSGVMRLWNLQDENQQITVPLHSDCCNGVNFHPTLPILATSAGQYHFIDVTQEDEPQDEVEYEKVIDYENSLLLTWCGPTGP